MASPRPADLASATPPTGETSPLREARLYAEAEQIFHEACDLSAHDRAALLERTAARSEPLADLVRRHRETRGQVGDFLDPDSSTVRTGIPAADVAAGYGPYEPKRLIGAGGMGVVYLARDRHLGREVALKVLRTDSADGPGMARFRREAQILASLDHPGIAKLYGAGVETTPLGPQAWMAMELVAGRSLDEAAREGSPERVLELLAQVADAVEAAHRLGVVHRDLKAANVLVTAEGRAVVLDFGVALLRAEGRATSVHTLTGQVLGSLVTMAPEQTLGNGAALDRRADVYALGALAYELLTGSLPVEVRGVGPAEAMRRIREWPPTPASQVAPHLPRAVERILGKALEKEPTDRYATAADFAADLRAHLAGRPVSARPLSSYQQALRLARRHRALVAATTAIIAALALGLSFALLGLSRARHAERMALELADERFIGLLSARMDSLWPAKPEMLPELQRWLDQAEGIAARYELSLASAAPAVAGLDALLDPEEGALVALRERVAWARDLHGASIESQRDAWEAAAARVAAAPAYGGLELPPQLGLVPLGPDPRSGLEEFAVFGTGSIPRREEQSGELLFSGRSAVVLVLLPGGPFLFGQQGNDPTGPNYSPFSRRHEGPPITLDLDPFFLSKYETTQGQYLRVMGDNPSQSTPADSGQTYQVTLRHPVESLPYAAALEFARRLDLLLPTEVQHQYATRAGTTTGHWAGELYEDLDGKERVAGLERAGSYLTPRGPRAFPVLRNHTPTGAYAPNPFGLYDMIGNLAEWCRDPFLPTLEPSDFAPGDGARLSTHYPDGGLARHRVLRGGAGVPAQAWTGHRTGAVENTSHIDLGFRVSRAVDRIERGRP